MTQVRLSTTADVAIAQPCRTFAITGDAPNPRDVAIAQPPRRASPGRDVAILKLKQ